MSNELEKQGIASRQRIYDFLVDFITKNGYPPTTREICEGTDIKSTASVHDHLLTLEKMGLIHFEEYKPRTISLVGYKFVKDK